MTGTGRAPWLFGPAPDLLLGAGLLSLPVLALARFGSALSPTATTLTFAALVLVCNQPHYFATLWRALRDTDADDARRRALVQLTALVVVALALVHVVPALLPGFFALYLTWSPFHYSAQNFGIAQIFCGRAGLRPTVVERRLLKSGMLSVYAAWALSFHARPSSDLVSTLGLPTGVVDVAAPLLLVSFVVLCAVALVRLARRAAGAARGAVVAVALLVVSQGLWLGLSVVLELSARARGALVDPLLVSGGAIALLHCAQYLWLIAFVERASDRPPPSGASLALVLVVGGVALFLPVPWALSVVLDVDLIHSLLAFQAAVNVHHFLVDARLWRLREAATARLVFAPRVRPAPPLARPLSPAWAVLGAGAIALFSLELIRTAAAQPTAPAWTEEIAAAVAPHTTPVVMPRVVAAVERGDLEVARATIDDAIAHGNVSPEVARVRARLEALLSAPPRRALVENPDAQ